MEATPAGQNDLKALKILHGALLGGVLIFGIITYALVYNAMVFPALKSIEQIMQGAAILTCISGIYFGDLLFKKQLDLARQSNDDTTAKLNIYRAACILKWAMLEGPSLFTIICFLLTGNYVFLLMAGIMAVILFLSRPSREKIILHLQLNEEGSADL